MEHLISIIVPVYKVEKYLNRCIESIVAQTYKNLEIILVDDGSPDNCPKMCDSWAQRDERIKVIHKPNGGLSDARNAGLDIAKGDMIAFVDSDDYIDTKMYQIMMDAMQIHDADLVSCGRYIVSNQSMRRQRCLREAKTFDSVSAVRELLSDGVINEASWDKLYKKKLFENIRFPVGEINEDVVIMPQILDQCKKIVHVGVPLYYYCQNEGSITKSGYNTGKRIILKHMKQITVYVEKNHPELEKAEKLFQAKHALSMLMTILSEESGKKDFESDYFQYLSILKETIGSMLCSHRISISEKVKALLILTGAYVPIRNMKKKYFK